MRLINIEPSGYSEEARTILQSIGTLDEGPFEKNDLLSKIGAYDIAITRLAHSFDRQLLTAAKNLKLVVTATTGLNHIDLHAAKDLNIEVLSLRGETEFLDTICSTAELAWALLLQLMRPVAQAREDVLLGNWRRDRFKGYEISGKTIGILGCGRLGRKTAAHAKAFGARVIVHDVKTIDSYERVSLEDLLKDSDILFVHLPYNEITHHFLDEEKIGLMKNGARVINTARGEIIEEAALLKALQSGNIAGAALDVLQGENGSIENWPNSDPLIDYARHNNNLIITPHIGGAAFEAMERTEIFMAEKLKNFVRAKYGIC